MQQRIQNSKPTLTVARPNPQSEKQPPRGVVKTKTVFLSSFGYFLGSPALVPSAWLSSPFSSLNKSEGGVARLQCIGSFSCPQGCKEQFCAALLLLYVRADTAALSSGPIPQGIWFPFGQWSQVSHPPF